MVKNIHNIGSILSKTEQKSVHGGDIILGDPDCPFGQCRNFFGRCSTLACNRV
ncbi:hypothetical protein P8625_04655 [Tenacibaculum tangerinum]|uniref:Bacteriocin n=1 Tax=Tenacibaculum tangerinum TaxID=3038772 RepID=A0ABY8L878_9FLAO|nr:hypothetical protein [Tenacibaculum tangerinum]WGH76455.1 hypothetical protein P8625_04655 [Tenacibaculum tangerinum]